MSLGASAVLNDGISVEVTQDDGTTVVTVAGEIDLSSAPALEGMLDAVDATERVVLECSGVRFMDSSGLRLLALESRRITNGGGTLRLRNPSTSVRRMVQIAGFEQLIEAESSTREPVRGSPGA